MKMHCILHFVCNMGSDLSGLRFNWVEGFFVLRKSGGAHVYISHN